MLVGRGGLRGAKMVNKNFVNKLAFPKNAVAEGPSKPLKKCPNHGLYYYFVARLPQRGLESRSLPEEIFMARHLALTTHTPLIKPTFFCASFFPFFALSAPPFPGHFSSPKSTSFWDLRSTLSRREKATCRGWVLGDGSGRGRPRGKKENPFFLAREKR